MPFSWWHKRNALGTKAREEGRDKPKKKLRFHSFNAIKDEKKGIMNSGQKSGEWCLLTKGFERLR